MTPNVSDIITSFCPSLAPIGTLNLVESGPNRNILFQTHLFSQRNATNKWKCKSVNKCLHSIIKNSWISCNIGELVSTANLQRRPHKKLEMKPVRPVVDRCHLHILYILLWCHLCSDQHYSSLALGMEISKNQLDKKSLFFVWHKVSNIKNIWTFKYLEFKLFRPILTFALGYRCTSIGFCSVMIGTGNTFCHKALRNIVIGIDRTFFTCVSIWHEAPSLTPFKYTTYAISIKLFFTCAWIWPFIVNTNSIVWTVV